MSQLIRVKLIRKRCDETTQEIVVADEVAERFRHDRDALVTWLRFTIAGQIAPELWTRHPVHPTEFEVAFANIDYPEGL